MPGQRERTDDAGVDDPEDHRWRRGLIGADTQKSLLYEERAKRSRTSRLLHNVGEVTSHAWAGLAVALAVVAWVGIGIAVQFPSWWQATLYSVSSVVTLVMVFALQHTQTRQQSATQRKLDELLRSQPKADEGLMALEEAPDDELEALAGKNLEERRRAHDQRAATAG